MTIFDREVDADAATFGGMLLYYWETRRVFGIDRYSERSKSRQEQFEGPC